MINLLFSHPIVFAIVFPGILFTIVLHEYAHCWTADRLGDPTPRVKGRLTLDPRAHLDPLGVIVMLFTRFGWGKPAPYDPYNLQNPVRDTALIAASGAILNLVIAAILSFVVRFLPYDWTILTLSLMQLSVINIYLAVFNFIPVKPLDGSKVLIAFLPKEIAYEYEQFMDRFGTMILLLLLIPFSGGQAPINYLVSPIANLILGFLF
jgi:Zn-dependent protease